LHLITLKDIHLFCRTSLDEISARRRDFLPDNTQHPAPARFKPPISTSDRPQTYNLDLAASEMGTFIIY